MRKSLEEHKIKMIMKLKHLSREEAMTDLARSVALHRQSAEEAHASQELEDCSTPLVRASRALKAGYDPIFGDIEI